MNNPNRALPYLYGIAFVSGFSLGVFAPLMAIRMERAGADGFWIGTGSALYFLAVALGTPLAAALIARFNVGTVMAAGLYLAGMAAPWFGIVTGVPAWSLVRVALGLCVGLYMVGGQTALNRLAGRGNRARVMAAHATAFGAGLGLGPVAGTQLYAWFSGRAFLAGSVVLWIGASLAWFRIEMTAPRAEIRPKLRLPPGISLPLHGVFIYGAFEAVMVSLFPVLLAHRGLGVRETGFALTLFVFGGGAGMLPASYCGDRWGRMRALAALSAVGLASALCLSWLGSTQSVLAVSFLMGASIGPVFPLSLALLGDILPEDELPAGSAWFTAAFGYGCVAGPLLASLSMSRLGDGALFLAVDALLALLLVRFGLRIRESVRLNASIPTKEETMQSKPIARGPVTRRTFLKASAAVAGGAALGAFGYKLGTAVDYGHPAYRLWGQKRKGDLGDLEYLVLCGVLAANPHNSQAWKFRLGSGDGIEVLADGERSLGSADPRRRLMTMGVGCALENMQVAAAALGYASRLETPGRDGWLGGARARLRLVKADSPVRAPAFDAIFRRQTTRSPYDMEGGVSDEFQNRFRSPADMPALGVCWFQEKEALVQMAAMQVQGARQWLGEGERHHDGIRWWRYSREEWESKGDGLSIFTSAAPFVIKQGLTWFASREMMEGEFGKKGEIDWVESIAPSTPAWGLIYAKSDSPAAWLDAGRLAERIYLEATLQDYRICPMSYLTEHEEMKARLKRVAGLSGSAEPLFLFRAGRAPLLEKSVRRDLRKVIV